MGSSSSTNTTQETVPESVEVEETTKSSLKATRIPIALCYGYLGTGFHGLCRNHDLLTVESVLLDTLSKLGMIEDQKNRNIGVLHWSQASRTDSGVHACAQVLSFFTMLPNGMKIKDVAQAIQKSLPKDSPIRIWKGIMPNRSFNSQSFADSRRYQYIIPTHAFSSAEPTHIEYLENQVLSLFLGEKNYHNYTKKADADSRSVNRTITCFSIKGPIVIQDHPYMIFQINGKSFMINQIRKMIAVVLAVSHDVMSINDVQRSFTKEAWDIPKVPGTCLLLDFVEYFSNPIMKKYPDGNTPPDKDLHFSTVRGQIEQWKNDVLFPHIHSEIVKNDEFRSWIRGTLKQYPPCLHP